MTKAFRIILSILAAVIIFAQTAFAQLPSVVNITISGHNYQLIELIEHNTRWYKHEPEYWVYKQLDVIYPLTIHKEDYQANKVFLKSLPDHRDFYTKHPHIQKAMFIGNMASLALNILQVVHI
jgi:hypothetical protein